MFALSFFAVETVPVHHGTVVFLLRRSAGRTADDGRQKRRWDLCSLYEGNSWKKEEAARDVGVGPRMGDFLEQEWIKASWKKGECREEIKLVAGASGLGFDDARIVVRHHRSRYRLLYCTVLRFLFPAPQRSLHAIRTDGWHF